MAEPIFNLQNCSYTYTGSEEQALKEITFSVYAGEKVVLLGSNGSGKSTLLKLLDGLYFPDQGSIQAFGQALTEDALKNEAFNFNFRSKVGFVFQESDAQLFMPSVYDEVAFAPLQLDISTEDVKARVDQALRNLRIEHLKDRAPHQLSGGEKKKVALASLLTLQPEVWLFDEPTAGLDPRSVKWLIEFMNKQASQGKTIILSTHDLQVTSLVADRVYLIGENHGICSDGTAEEILNDRDLLERENLL